MLLQIRCFLSDEDGLGAIEYALLAALLSTAIVGSIQNLHLHVSPVLGYLGQVMANGIGSGGGS